MNMHSVKGEKHHSNTGECANLCRLLGPKPVEAERIQTFEKENCNKKIIT